MEFRLNIKPTRTTANDKKTAIEKGPIGHLFWSCSPDYGTGYTQLITTRRDECVYVYTSQKRRGKVCKVSNMKTSTYWEVYTYRIPVAILKAMGKKVKQGHRTFTLE